MWRPYHPVLVIDPAGVRTPGTPIALVSVGRSAYTILGDGAQSTAQEGEYSEGGLHFQWSDRMIDSDGGKLLVRDD